MQLSEHLTPSVFRRYNMTDDADLDVAAEKLDAAVVKSQGADEKRRGRMRAFRKRA